MHEFTNVACQENYYNSNSIYTALNLYATIVQTKSGIHVIVCLELLSKTLMCTLNFS